MRSIASRRIVQLVASLRFLERPLDRLGAGSSRRAFSAPQRLCWRSSVFWAPWSFVPQDGVEDGEEFTGRGDGDEHFGLAGVDEALAKGLEDGIVTAGGEACDPLAVEGSEFGQFGDERAGGDRPDARNGGEEV